MIFIRSNTNIRRRDLFLLHILPAVLVFIAVMLIIILNAQSTQLQDNNDQRDRAISQAEKVESRIRERLITYEDVARASSAFISGSEDTTEDEFKRFIDTFKLTQRYPGLQSIMYAQYVSAEDIPLFEEEQRRKGIDSFDIFPEIEGERGLITTYSVSLINSSENTRGFNLLSEPVRAEAITKAIDKGDVVVTENLRLLSDPDKGQGFLMITPIYRSEETPNDPSTRQRAATGVIVASYLAENLFSSIFRGDKEPDFAFSVSQGNNPPMYVSPAYEEVSNKRGVQELDRVFNAMGRDWKLNYVFVNGDLGTGLSASVLRTLVGGVLFSFLLATLVFILLLSRTRSLGLAEEREIQNAKDDLLSLASHQLRTPATSVKQYLGMIKDGYAGDLNDQQSSLLNEAYVSNERQLGIINEMLYVARADAGRIILDKAPLPLNKLLRDIHKDQLPRAKSFQQRLNLIVPKMDVVVCGDSHYLRMAIENVVSNAIKYTPEKGSVTVKLSRSKKEAIIIVSDTGVGIPKNDHRKIFDKFSRVPNALSTRTNGTGIGLYLTKQIVDLHEGNVSFTSDNGKGSTFTITIPKEDDPQN